jgi:dihydrodipicolinate synthase/N-acetylneuraminate lyase
MKKLYPLHGIVTVLNTPFTTDDKIDLRALKQNVEMAIRAGVAGFLVPAMASEVYKLGRDERRSMVAAVLEQTDNRVLVIGGAGEVDAIKRRDVVSDLIDLGCKNVLLQIPFETEVQYKSVIHDVAEMGIEMIMLQDWDANGYGLPIELICELFEKVDAFRCLKIEVVPAGVKYSKVREATNGALNISGGWAVMQMIEGLERGVHAFMPTGMHDIYVAIYNLYKAGQHARAKELFEELLPVLAFSNQHLDISIHFFKRLLFRQGLFATPNVRKPILPFDDLHQRYADKHIEHVLELSSQLDGWRI